MKKGIFIVIEGTDGSGKTEQTKLLVERLKTEGKKVTLFDFPRYGNPSAWFVEEYLNGRFGGLNEISPKTASLFFALDRYAAARNIKNSMKDGNIVISNRYVASNLAHQGSKFENERDRKKYFEWNYDLEYRINGIPKPNLNIILHVPAAIAQKLVDGKAERKHLGGKKRDLHEADLKHLARTETTYKKLSKCFPSEFTWIECVEKQKLLSIETIHDRVWKLVSPLLGKFDS
ncbi:MAG: dTMP kinase [Patescibacteria group bacterium]